jgi:hypothetical protein
MKHLQPTTRFLLLFLLAIITHSWPIPPAAAQNATPQMIDFEDIADGARLDTLYPGIEFRSTSGSWRSGDTRTGNYNAPYPADCPAFNGQCAYAVHGSGFAWVGAGGGNASIHFQASPTAAVKVSFSTAGSITIRALDRDGNQIGSQRVAANLRTGQLATVSFSAADIGSLQIEGTANTWIMDDLVVLSSDISGVPIVALADPANVTVAQALAGTGQLTPGALLALTLTATNRGAGEASNTIIRIPLSQQHVQIIDARFSQPGVWVSRILSDTIEVQTGKLRAHGDTITATLSLRVAAQAEAGYTFGQPVQFRWIDKRVGGSGQSNRLQAIVGQHVPTQIGTLSVTFLPTQQQFVLDSGNFLPNEPVSFWYHVEQGPAMALATINAQANGAVRLTQGVEAPPATELTFVAEGVWSGITVTDHFRQP